ncbi:hypothetical protein FHT97_004013 [Rhizobium sp. BK399]|nr:hypothetical protein [Rhizobium sp. BK399]
MAGKIVDRLEQRRPVDLLGTPATTPVPVLPMIWAVT